MSTGCRYIFSNGEVFRSQLNALLYLKRNPSLRVIKSEKSELSMAVVKETDVTDDFTSILSNHGYGSGR